MGVVVWVHYAPPLADSLRKRYHQMLSWNDELPFVKFAVADDDRPTLSAEVAAAALTRDALGLAIARELVQSHGGSLSLSDPGPGAVFAIEIPITT